jgi:PAS domain S-box-containing protein
MLLKNIPIRRKLIAINLLTSTVVLVLMIVSVFTYEYLRLRQATVRQLSTVGQIIAANSTAALAFANQNDADEILSALKGKPHISAAALYDKNGKLFSKYPANLSDDSLPGAPQKDGFQYEREFLSVFQPVMEDDKRLGTLYLKYDSGAVMREWLSASIGIAGAVMTIALLVGYLLSRKLQQQISQPILALAGTAKSISEQRDFSVRAKKLGDDELGLLTDAFNEMLAEIHKLNATLEQRVAGRTAELESANVELQREVTERINAEQALSAALEKERLLLNSAVDVICTVDVDGKFVSVNPACQQLWGYTQEELIGRRYIELVVPDDVARTNEAAAKIRTGENATDFENRYRHKNGSQVHVMWSASWSEKQQLTFSVARDITQRHLVEEKLQKSAAELERSNSELQDFASVASHDLQEPLRKIQSFADELKVSMGNKIDVDEKDTLDRIIAAGERMRTLINDLLAFSRVTSMAKPFAMVNLNLIVKEVLSDLEARIQQTKGIVEVCDLPTIDADPMQIYQLLQNLIGNGLKFHAPGVAPVIKISGKNGGPNYQLSVTDNGIGFDEKYLDRIFTVFQRLHGRKEYEGTGIGLAICRKIAERHGGQIIARSAPGAGSTFTVTLPLKQSNEEKP